MGMFLGDLDLDNVPDRTYDPIPDGWYTAQIKDAKISDTKDGTGKRLNVRFDVTGPSHAGAVVFAGLNIRNKNPDAERIALQDLKAMRDAGGIGTLTDTDQLIGAMMEVKVVTVPPRDGYDAKNEIKGYRPASGGAPAPVARPAPSAAPTAAASKAPPPWAQKKASPVTAPAAAQANSDEPEGLL